ncbi:hypothetical protein CEXT_218921 [Caerostris extrusa]|uniref:Uncharacterized protein n=1 Tax=Caerostris extrusa TaxID=172846 RepID=A0AAV4T9C9_CAEEX|nr:hypothetical protein CEXT_218921 [Caerostris extrusa]
MVDIKHDVLKQVSSTAILISVQPLLELRVLEKENNVLSGDSIGSKYDNCSYYLADYQGRKELAENDKETG